MSDTDKILLAINQQTVTLRKLIDDNNLEIKSLRLEINKINAYQLKTGMEMVRLKEENENLKRTSKMQNDRLQRIERGLKAKNLVFNGIPEPNDECNVKEIIHQIINEKLEVACNEDDIESVERLGAKGKYPRTVHVKFRKELLRNTVIKNRKELKGTSIFIDEDFPYEVRQERKILREVLKSKKQCGQNGYIRYNKLIIDGEEYTVEDIKNKAMPLDIDILEKNCSIANRIHNSEERKKYDTIVDEVQSKSPPQESQEFRRTAERALRPRPTPSKHLKNQ